MYMYNTSVQSVTGFFFHHKFHNTNQMFLDKYWTYMYSCMQADYLLLL